MLAPRRARLAILIYAHKFPEAVIRLTNPRKPRRFDSIKAG